MLRNTLYTAALFILFVILLTFYSPAGARKVNGATPATVQYKVVEASVSLDVILERLQPVHDGIELVSLNPQTNELTVRYAPAMVSASVIDDVLRGANPVVDAMTAEPATESRRRLRSPP